MQARAGLLEVQERRVECRDAVAVGDAVIVCTARRHRSGGVVIVCRSMAPIAHLDIDAFYAERRAAAPSGAARPAGDRLGQRPARGRHDGVLRGSPLRRRLGDADVARAAPVPGRRARARRTSRPTARRRAPSWRSSATRSTASRSSASTRPTSTSAARRAARGDAPARDRRSSPRRGWTARSGSVPTGSSRRSARTPRSRAASSSSRARRRARASRAVRRGSCPGSGRRPPSGWRRWGSRRCGALAATPVDVLVARFGANHGPDLQRRARFEAIGRG